MILSNEIKNKIKEEYESWFESQYGNSTKERRDELGAIYTPPDITIQMIEKLESLDGNILDPCCGTGNLLAGCILAGANPNNVYGNEYEEEFMLLARQRLGKLGVPSYHIHQGDATDKNCIKFDSFTETYQWPFDEQLQMEFAIEQRNNDAATIPFASSLF